MQRTYIKRRSPKAQKKILESSSVIPNEVKIETNIQPKNLVYKLKIPIRLCEKIRLNIQGQ